MSEQRQTERSIFLAAIEIATAAERAAFLDQACAGNQPLRAEVDALLLAHEKPQRLLDAPVAPGPTIEEKVSERPGTMIGPYKLLEQIGEGGFGVVFMAEQQEPVRRKVALKILKPGMDTRQVVARFEAERQALAIMDHPNIAKVFDGGMTGVRRQGSGGRNQEAPGVSLTPDSCLLTPDVGRPYFVMELVKGVPITQYCDEYHLTPRQRLELFIPVCEAVQHAHQKGIIHRDLKPGNLLVGRYDGKPVPKVIDFGVVKALGQKLTEETLFTSVGAVVGTLEYMSPEQAQLDNVDVDTRSDVYTLGVVLYELLTGATPLQRKRLKDSSLLEVLRVIREEEPPRPSARLSTSGELPAIAAQRGVEPKKLSAVVRGELDWIVMKALEKDRNRRYQTANGFAMDLQRYLAGETVLAPPPSPAYRLRKLVQRNKGAMLAATILFAVLVAGIAGTTWQAVQATRERNAKQAALEQSRVLSAELAFDKGQLLGERGDADLALHWLARSLQLAPPDAVELQAAIRLSLGAWQRQVNSVRLVLPHDGWVGVVDFALDGRLVTATCNEKTNAFIVHRWDPATGRHGEPLTVPSPGGLGAERPAISPDSKQALVSFTDEADGIIQLVDLASAELKWKWKTRGSHATCACFSPDSKAVLVGYCIGPEETVASTGQAQLFEVATGRRIGPSLEHTRPVFAAAFHRDGQSFVTACGLWANAAEKSKTQFWKLDGTKIHELEHSCMAQSVALSPDGNRLLTGHPDRKARLWNLSAPEEPLNLNHEAPVLSAAFRPDGKALLTGSADGTVRVWDLTGKLLCQPLRHGSEVWSARFSPDGKAILVGAAAPNRSRYWDLTPSGMTGLNNDPIVFPLAFSPDRRTIVTHDSAHTVRLQDSITGQLIGRPLPHPRPLLIEGVSTHPGQRHACSSDRSRAVTVDEDNVARLWNTQTGERIAELKPFPEQTAQPTFFAAAFSPDGKVLVTGNFNGAAHIWDSASGKRLHNLELHEMRGPVFNAAFSPEGKLLATVGADNVARFWNPRTGEALGPPLLHPSTVFAVAFSPDGKTVATCGADPMVQLWDVALRTPVRRLFGHRGGANTVAFSPDGRFIVTGSHDETARLWDAASGKTIGPPMRHPVPVSRVAFAADGKTILTSTEEKISRSWPLPEAIAGSPKDIERWVQVQTGLELEADGGVRVLDAIEWQKRRHELGNGLDVQPNP